MISSQILRNYYINYANPQPILKKQNLSADKSHNFQSFNDAISAIPCYHLISFKAKGKDLVQELGSNDSQIDALNKIDSLTTPEKQEFVHEYCKLTGFPDLAEIKRKMTEHIIEKAQQSAKDAGVRILSGAYHRESSYTHDVALPGSDIDAMSFIIEGGLDNRNHFKGNLWRSVNPLLVSIRIDYEFPDIYTLDQLYQWTGLVDEIARKNNLDKKESFYSVNKTNTQDFKKSLAFNIDIARAIDQEDKNYIKAKAPDFSAMIDNGELPKHITQSVSSLLESLRSGHLLIDCLNDAQPDKLSKIKDSFIYKYGNMCMQECTFPEEKIKYKARNQEINQENFEGMPLERQIALIKRMIFASFSSYQKSKVSSEIDHTLDYLFENNEGFNKNKDEAYRLCV